MTMTKTATHSPQRTGVDVVCQYVESFADGKCGSEQAEIVTINGVDVALCPDHEKRARAENADGDADEEAR